MSGALLRRAADQLAAGLAAAAPGEERGCWRAFLPEGRHPYYRNTALPVCEPGPNAAATLSALCRVTGRRLRVELMAELWPDLAPLLVQGGFVVEDEEAVLASEAAPPGEAGALLLTGAEEKTMLRGFLNGTAASFGDAAAGEEELASFAAGLGTGAIAASVCLDGNRPVAGAALLRCAGGAELSGVWCAPEQRRHGHASRACVTLLQPFFRTGGSLAWLATAPDRTGFYERLGFRRAGTLLRLALPEA